MTAMSRSSHIRCSWFIVFANLRNILGVRKESGLCWFYLTIASVQGSYGRNVCPYLVSDKWRIYASFRVVRDSDLSSLIPTCIPPVMLKRCFFWRDPRKAGVSNPDRLYWTGTSYSGQTQIQTMNRKVNLDLGISGQIPRFGIPPQSARYTVSMRAACSRPDPESCVCATGFVKQWWTILTMCGGIL